MKKLVIGIIAASIAVFMFGFLFWGATQLPYRAWKRTPDDVAAGQALRQHFPEAGTYYVPGMHHDDQTLTELYEKGPLAFVHVTSTEGRPVFDRTIMIKGFLHNALVVVLIAILMQMALPALDSYAKRVRFTAFTGLVAVVLINFGETVWWQLPMAWQMQLAMYNFGFFLVAGLVLAYFIRPKERA